MSTEQKSPEGKQTAGAFDIRTIIGGLIVALGFIAWWRWRPIVVATTKGEPGDD
jgi:hypothetical protein